MPRHTVCDQHGLLDAWGCGKCSNMRQECQLQPTEDHRKCVDEQNTGKWVFVPYSKKEEEEPIAA